MVTKELLEKKLAELRKQREQAYLKMHVLDGAIQLAEQLLVDGRNQELANVKDILDKKEVIKTK